MPLNDESKVIFHSHLWTPQPGPQLAAIEATWCYEICYGGARGGGKSIYLLMDFLQDVPKYGNDWHGILIRRTYPELEQVIRDSWKMFPQTGAEYEKQPKTWHWPNGATLRFRNLDKPEDAQQYQGHAYTWFGLDEAGNYPTPDVYFLMLATLRSGEGAPSRARLTANPGGPGHHWIKHRFIDPAPLGFKPVVDKGDTRERIFIPSRITDNKILMKNDPYYVENLKKQTSPELVRAWLLGDWDIQISSYYPEFRRDKHVIPPFHIPVHWSKFRSFDWGAARPFAVLWWAVCDGTPVKDASGTERTYPRGSLICYREWYGMADGRPNVGIRMRNEDIANGIVGRTGVSEEIAYTVTDSLPFQDRGGPKIAEVFANCKVPLKRGDDTRIAGWAQLRSRLQGFDMREPLIYFFPTCLHTVRTLPALQADKHNFEDVDDSLEDHAPDAVRLACMERPLVKDKKPDMYIKPTSEMTFNEFLKWNDIHGHNGAGRFR